MFTKPHKIFSLLKYVSGLALCIFFLNPCPTIAQAISKEYQAKAVFLLNFSRFVTWPESCFEGPQAPFIIGIIGDDPFGNYLDETIKGEKMMDHPIIARHYKSLADIAHCHILFIHDKDSAQLRKIVERLKTRKILTVSDGKNFTSMGGMIALYTIDNNTRLCLNDATAKEVDLVISAKLLRLAETENR